MQLKFLFNLWASDVHSIYILRFSRRFIFQQRSHGDYVVKKSRDSWQCFWNLDVCFSMISFATPTLVSLRGLILIFRQASPSLLHGSYPRAFHESKAGPGESATKQAQANLESSPDVFFFHFWVSLSYF